MPKDCSLDLSLITVHSLNNIDITSTSIDFKLHISNDMEILFENKEIIENKKDLNYEILDDYV